MEACTAELLSTLDEVLAMSEPADAVLLIQNTNTVAASSSEPLKTVRLI